MWVTVNKYKIFVAFKVTPDGLSQMVLEEDVI